MVKTPEHDPRFLVQRFHPAYALAEVERHKANARQGDVGAIHELVDENGFYGALVVQEKTPGGERRMKVIVGNHRHLTLEQKGITHAPMFFVTVSDEHAARIMVGDNRASDRASYDESLLVGVLGKLAQWNGHLRGTGYDGEDLRALIAKLKAPTNTEMRASLNDAAESAWQTVGLKLPPKTLELFHAALSKMPDTTTHEKVRRMSQRILALVDNDEPETSALVLYDNGPT